MKPPALSSVVVTMGRQPDVPWWTEEVRADHELCPLSVKQVVFRGKASKQVAAWELPFFLVFMLPIFLELRRKYDYMFTFECSLTTFGLAFWQTLFFSRKPRHVILQFIMREKTLRLGSRLKYTAMKWCFRSVHLAVCSATGESEYYRQAFGWPERKAAFVPYHTTGKLLAYDARPDEGYIMAAGRVFRDYPTFYEAIGQSPHRAIVVASPTAPRPPATAANIQFLHNIPLDNFEDIMRSSRVVVVPLEDRRLSAGQLVMLQAMALGKPVVATKTTGTIDYITDGVDGLLVEPNSPAALRAAIDRIMADPELRLRLSKAARQNVLARHLPHHYTKLVREAIARSNRA